MQDHAHAAQRPQLSSQTTEPGLAQLISPAIAGRLRAEGVRTLEDWRALGRRRHRIFGIVPHVVRELDALARGCGMNATVKLPRPLLTLRPKVPTPAHASPMPTSPAPFWVIWRVGGKRPTRRHPTLTSARQEAARLKALHPAACFEVFELRLGEEQLS